MAPINLFPNFKKKTYKKKINMLFTELGRSVYGKKLCPWSWVWPSAFGLGPYSRPWAQFFPIRTSRPANNIYFFAYNTMGILLAKLKWLFSRRWTCTMYHWTFFLYRYILGSRNLRCNNSSYNSVPVVCYWYCLDWWELLHLKTNWISKYESDRSAE